MKNRFYLACFRDNVGSNVAFHAFNGMGYVTDIDKAHIYTKDEAQKAWNSGRDFDQPISADHVDALSIRKVDCQYINSKSKFLPDCKMYCAFVSTKWDGNDVYWLTEKLPSTDFSLAKKYTPESFKLDEKLVFVPFDLAAQKSRRTFDYA